MPGLTFFIGAVAVATLFGEWPQDAGRTLSCDANAFAPNIGVDDLVRRFGGQNVTTDSILLGEGAFQRGTVLFRGDPRARVEVVWQDTLAQRAPRFVRIRGDTSLWTSAAGITLGTTLRVIERMNGTPFRLAGFGFDGSGSIMSWSKGKLAAPANAPCELRGMLEPAMGATVDSRWYKQVRGDREFSSGHPAMQALNPRVRTLTLVYATARHE